MLPTFATAQVSVHVSPALRIGDTVQYSASVVGSSNSAVNWKVNGIAAGNSTVGDDLSVGVICRTENGSQSQNGHNNGGVTGRFDEVIV